MLHLVYCIKNHVQGYCVSSSFVLGYFSHRHMFSRVKRKMVYCVYVLYSMCEFVCLIIPAAAGVKNRSPQALVILTKL